MTVTFDNSQWPISFQRLPGTWTDQTLVDLEQAMLAIASRRERYAAVIEFDGFPAVGALHRRQAAALFEKHGRWAKQYCVGVAVVAPSAAVRGLRTAVRWIVPAPYEEECFATRQEAEAWVRALLRREGAL